MADALLTALRNFDGDLGKVKAVEELVDVAPPLHLVVTQVRSIGSCAMGHPAFMSGRDLADRGVPVQGKDGRNVLVAQTTLLCPCHHYGDAMFRYTPSDIFRDFIGICVSNTMVSPRKDSALRRPNGGNSR